MRQVRATRYVTPLREGGSLPGIVEADDLGHLRLQVPRRRPGAAGAGGRGRRRRGRPAGRRAGAATWSTVDLAPEIGRYEADEEVQDLLNASLGLNLGVDLLPGAFGYDPAHEPRSRARRADPVAGRAVRQRRPLAGATPTCWSGAATCSRSTTAPRSTSTTPGRGGTRRPAASRRSRTTPASTSCAATRPRPRAQDEELAARVTAEACWTRCSPRCPTSGWSRCRSGVAGRAAGARTSPTCSPALDGAARLAAGAGERRMNGYQYVALRCVPRVDREEFVNVGVVLYCHAADFLGSACAGRRGPAARARPGRRPGGGPARAGSGRAGLPRRGPRRLRRRLPGHGVRRPRGRDDQSTRFGFLRAPRSTVVQPGPVHGGLTDDPPPSSAAAGGAGGLSVRRLRPGRAPPRRRRSGPGSCGRAPGRRRAGSETATAPASRASSAARSGRKPGARNIEATATWRRPSARNARTASPVAGGADEANAAVTGSLWRAPQTRASRATAWLASGSEEPAAASTRASSSRTRASLSASRRRRSSTSRKRRLEAEDAGGPDLQPGVPLGGLRRRPGARRPWRGRRR